MRERWKREGQNGTFGNPPNKLSSDVAARQEKRGLLSPHYGRRLAVLGQEPQILLVFAGPDVVEAQCRRLEVRSKRGGKVLFAADEEEVVMTSEKFTITG